MRLFCCLALALAACGTDTSSNAENNTGNDAGTSDAGISDAGISDAGTDGGASACTTSPAVGQPAFVGSVEFAPFSSTDFSADATFRGNFGAVVQLSGCTGTQVGNCCFSPQGGPSCPFPDETSAGNITVTKSGAQIAQLTFANDYDADTSSSPALTWQPGDTLSVSAAGSSGAVGSFSGSVVAPSPLANVTPAFGSTATIQKANDLVITWTPGTGTAVVQLFLEDIALNGIGCTVPVTAGTLTVSSTLLTRLGGSGSLILDSTNETTVTGTNAKVVISADTAATIVGTTYQ
jgi:hypothetical protein